MEEKSDRSKDNKDDQAPDKSTKQKLNNLRANLNNSTTFLDNLKRDITNLKLLIHQDSVNNLNSSLYREYCNKTDVELDDEMERVKNKLAELQNRLITVKAALEMAGDNS